MAQTKIVSGYARMWPREVFEKVEAPTGRGKKMVAAKLLGSLEGPGVYILYRNDEPYYIGQARNLRHRLWTHATKADGRYFHFWNFFSAFKVKKQNINAIEGILIAAMPTAANNANPKLPKEKMHPQVKTLLRNIYRS
jgi:hypothetical protein